MEAENIEATDEEFDAEIEKMAKAYNLEADKMKEMLGEKETSQMKKDIAVQKAVTLLAEAAKEI